MKNGKKFNIIGACMALPIANKGFNRNDMATNKKEFLIVGDGALDIPITDATIRCNCYFVNGMSRAPSPTAFKLP